MRTLGLEPTGGNFRHIGARIRYLELDTSHFDEKTIAARCRALTDETLAPLVAASRSVAQVASALGLETKGRWHHELGRRIAELELDTRHFQGRGWSRGQTKVTDASVAAIAAKNGFPNDIVFVENSPLYMGRPSIRRLLELGWTYACSWCGVVEWRGQPLVLHLDHINGIHNDNRFENLRLLCPNCHSQTPTYSNRRR